MAWYLRELALRKGVQVEITELDIQSDRRSDFTIPAVQKKWLQLIAQGIYYAVIVTPPCSTFSRAVWANDLGPFPLRSSTYPRGFPWNRADRFHKAEFGTILADFSFEALKRQFACGRRIGLMEQPEDLGRTNYERIPGHQPASMWQFWQFRQLLELPDVQTVVFAQSDFGTESPKPTRFLLRIFAPLHAAMHTGLPQFDEHGWYLGPLPRQSGGAPLIGKSKGVFRTAQSAAWPPQLCKWTAEAILTSFLQEWEGGGEINSTPTSRKRRCDEDPAGVEALETFSASKRRRLEEDRPVPGGHPKVVDPMNPPVPGGRGPPRACRWKGLEASFHDGGGLSSPGRWPPERRMKLEGREWVMVRHHILLAAVKRLGSVAEVEKEAFRMARGGDSFRLVREEAFLQEIRDILAEKLDIPRQERPEEGQPFFLDTMKGVLQRAGDPDWEFLEQAKTGLPLGILHEMPRTLAVFEEQVKWSLEGDGWGSAVWQKDNYASAAEHEKYLVEHLEQEVAEGLMVKMSEEDFVRTYGKNRAVAALAVLVEDELTGKKRVIHDGTHGVMVNHRIKCRDKVRMPGPREKRTLLEEYGADRAAVLSLVGDFAKAHRRFKYLEEEHGFLACKAATQSDTVYVNQVGTFGIASTPYWWARLSAALMRLVYWVLGGDFPNDMLLYADDLEVLAIGRQGRIGGVLAYAVMAALGAPFKWAKQRGGLVTEWIGLTTDYQSFSMGLSVKRTGWVLEWIASLRRRKEVTYREFAAGLGRLGFSALALPWERPLLGPLYAWASAIQMNRGAMTIPWAIQFILDWIAKRLRAGGHMEVVKQPARQGGRSLKIWTDAKATEQAAWIGGWLEECEDSKRCRWFSLQVTEVSAPWLYYRGKNPKRVIAALELLATLVALKLWLKSAGDSAEVCAEAFTDNRGNAFILKKGLSTKYPVTLLVIEVAETLRRCDAFATLTWVRRDGNELADALTNEDFSAFDHQRREAVEEGGLQWHVMDELLRGSEVLFNEIKEHKKKKQDDGPKLSLARKKPKKYFSRWKS